MRFLIALFLCCGSLRAQVIPFAFNSTNGPAAAASANLFDETFETPGTGYVAAGWTPSGDVNPDPVNATAPAPLDGSQSLRITIGGQTSATTIPITASGEVFIKFHFQIVSKIGNARIFSFLDVGNSVQAFSEFDTSNVSPVYNWYDSATGGAATPSAATAVATSYYTWARYKKASGGGNNGILEVEYNTANTRTGSGTKYAIKSNGNGTLDIALIRLGTANPETYVCVFDNVSVSNTGYPP